MFLQKFPPSLSLITQFCIRRLRLLAYFHPQKSSLFISHIFFYFPLFYVTMQLRTLQTETLPCKVKEVYFFIHFVLESMKKSHWITTFSRNEENLSTDLSVKTAQKQTSRNTKGPLVQDWVFRLWEIPSFLKILKSTSVVRNPLLCWPRKKKSVKSCELAIGIDDLIQIPLSIQYVVASHDT